MCRCLIRNKGTMINVHTDINSFPATIALEKQLDSPKTHYKSIFMYRSPFMFGEAASKQIDRNFAASKTKSSSSGSKIRDSFPDITWSESDDDEEWDVSHSDRSKLEDILSSENNSMKTERRRTTQGLVRCRSIHSELFMLGEDDVSLSPPPRMRMHHHHQDTSSSFSCTNDVNLESLVRISVPHSHVTVSG